MSKKYEIITWPEVQEWMEEPDFKEHSYLINDEKGMEEFGSSAYFVDIDWMEQIRGKYTLINDYYIKLINDKKVCVKDAHINDFLSYCEKHDVIPEYGLKSPYGKWFYL